MTSHQSIATPDESLREVCVGAADLPLACPRPGAPLWARHPRVFIDLLRAADGRARCPYCGTCYQYIGERGATPH